MNHVQAVHINSKMEVLLLVRFQYLLTTISWQCSTSFTELPVSIYETNWTDYFNLHFKTVRILVYRHISNMISIFNFHIIAAAMDNFQFCFFSIVNPTGSLEM